MDLENPFASFDIGSRHHNAAIKPSGTKQRGIQHVRPVSCSNENDPLVGFEAIHFDQQLIQSLLALIMAATKTGAAMTPHRVDFIDEGAFFLP